ncbi:GNAT family N-acetyltransferase [Shewanella sp. FJAT-52076]|uniref:GNAT family N-acetyltransferase n=1 Tax=Shewanella sp. FJAT-52076 TaxID=2864202 RepID=UPI001C654A0B|nr:GNAT family N-acetyltransferase [Shewanella sp. FJAT-52076]QYJ76888.1 GNAT family N-acetyltransferase [Shewanella sp. FJAT-52076]
MTIAFETQRLSVVEIVDGVALSEHSDLLERVPAMLTPAVVEHLPPYFHGVNSRGAADMWLERMLRESRLLQVKSKTHEIMGFLFIYVENEHHAHIGYLLAQAYWGKGLATELLQGFIGAAANTESWLTLVGGVDQAYTASTKLLEKLGFTAQKQDGNSPVFYEYRLSRAIPEQVSQKGAVP